MKLVSEVSEVSRRELDRTVIGESVEVLSLVISHWSLVEPESASLVSEVILFSIFPLFHHSRCERSELSP